MSRLPVLDHASPLWSADYYLRRYARGNLRQSKYAGVLVANGLPPHVGLAASVIGMDLITLKCRLRRGRPLLAPVRKYVKKDPDRDRLFRTKPRSMAMAANLGRLVDLPRNMKIPKSKPHN
jgi:hypothetical protein